MSKAADKLLLYRPAHSAMPCALMLELITNSMRLVHARCDARNYSLVSSCVNALVMPALNPLSFLKRCLQFALLHREGDPFQSL